MTQKPSPLNWMGIVSVGSGLLTFAAGVYLSTAKDVTADLRGLDQRITRLETRMDEGRRNRDEQQNRNDDRLDRIERHDNR